MHVHSLTKETNFTGVTVSLISHNMEMQMLMLLKQRMIKDNFLFHLTSASEVYIHNQIINNSSSLVSSVIAPFHLIEKSLQGQGNSGPSVCFTLGPSSGLEILCHSGPVRC